jgi:hypothetical protein
MGTSFEDILNRMRNAPHVGVPAVTNPKLPTKVEQDAAAFEARQREMPKFHFGTGSQLDNIINRMKDAPHASPTYADPSFHNSYIQLSDDELSWHERQFQEFKLKIHSKNKQMDTTTVANHDSDKHSNIKIYVVGSSKNEFRPLDTIREKYLIDEHHDGDNIDTLNPWYCELSGLYYLLKHCDANIVGLEQYRRFFLDSTKHNLLGEAEISSILTDFDVICAKEHYPNGNGSHIFTWPIRNGKKDDFFAFIGTVREMYGNDVANFFNEFLYGQWHCQGNLMIGKRQVIDEYFNWLFNTFAEYNKKVILTENNRRINGYISEFFFGAWLTMKNYKIYWAPYSNNGAVRV